MKRVLLTGGRAPATLELARLLHAAGAIVFMAESQRWHLCKTSNAIEKNVHVPAPRFDLESYINALIHIIQDEQIDLLIPTCEELFYVAQGRDQLTEHCQVFVSDIDTLNRFHNKWLFAQSALSYNLSVPCSQLMTNREGLDQWLGQPVVLKRAYSRFSTEILIKPIHRDELKHIEPTEQSPWIAQSFIDGKQWCSYSVVNQGKVTAHSVYQTTFSVGQGTAISFQSVNHQKVFDWVKRFVEAEQFTGQIAFDFIEDSSGKLFAIECNPRTTSGIHLFYNRPEILNAFIDMDSELLKPFEKPSMLMFPMLWYLFKNVRSKVLYQQWAASFRASRDVILSGRDLLPGLLQGVSVIQLLWLSLRKRMSPLAASTNDIEWNGPS